jgi:hypothetical protein
MYERWSKICTALYFTFFTAGILASPWILHLPLWMVLSTFVAILVLALGRRTLMSREFSVKTMAWASGLFMTIYWTALAVFCIIGFVHWSVYTLGNSSGLYPPELTLERGFTIGYLVIFALLGALPLTERILYPLGRKAVMQALGASEMQKEGKGGIYAAVQPIPEFVTRNIVDEFTRAGYLRRRTAVCNCKHEHAYYRMTENGRRFRLGLRAEASGLRQVV